jgi:hypothetical protein
MSFVQPVDVATTLKDERPFEKYRGLQIYVGTQPAPPGMNPGGAAPTAAKTQTFYSIAPTTKLLVGVSDPARLKAAIDQSFERGAVPLDLPKGHDLALRIKNLKEISGQLGATPNPMTSGIVGVTATLQMTDNLTFDIALETKDAQTASGFEQQVKLILQVLGMQIPAQPQANGSASSPSFLDAIKLSVTGNQFRVNGSVPVSQLAAAIPKPGQGNPMVGLPGSGAGPGTPAPRGPGSAAGGPPGVPGQPGAAPVGTPSTSPTPK